MTKIADVVEQIESIAPLSLAESWDNVGLLVGDRNTSVEHVLLTIDLTEAVFDEAVRLGASMIIAYHPPIFHPFKRLTDDDPKQRIILRAAGAGIAIHSPHSALDAAEGGINDWLARGIGQGDVRAIQPHQHLPPTEETKVVTFCPADAVDRVRNALSSIGAGRIGDYHVCSFEIRGTGTFFGGESTSPTVGRPGELERVDEVRLEMVCPVRSLGLAVAAIRNFHPYEEPPIEIYPLRARLERHLGAGRRITLDSPVPLQTLVERIRHALGSNRLLAAAGYGAPRKFKTIGVCAGSGGGLVDRAIDEGCEAFLTGEMSHHNVLAAQHRGCTVILAGHTNTERGYLKILRNTLADGLPDITISISKKDVDPLRVVE